MIFTYVYDSYSVSSCAVSDWNLFFSIDTTQRKYLIKVAEMIGLLVPVMRDGNERWRTMIVKIFMIFIYILNGKFNCFAFLLTNKEYL